MKIDKDNKRIKHIIDEEMRYISNKLEKNIFDKQDVIDLDKSFDDCFNALNKVDNNITVSAYKVPGEVQVREQLTTENKTVESMSANYIRNTMLTLIDRLNKAEDFYLELQYFLTFSSGMCVVYLKNISSLNNGTNLFEEVEKDYE